MAAEVASGRASENGKERAAWNLDELITRRGREKERERERESHARIDNRAAISAG